MASGQNGLERLQKVIARAGVCSRRKAEELIAAGRVRVNGRVVTELGTKVDARADRIEVDGVSVAGAQPRRYYALNKPAGVVTTAFDPQGRRSVLELLPKEVRLFPVGRLDYQTEGLLLLTNDGALAHRLAHPSYGVEKEYVVVVAGRVGPQALKTLREGVPLDDGMTLPAQVRVLERGKDWTRLALTLKEGRNRQIRRMGEAVGHPVLALRRVRYGPILLGDLPAGRWRRLSRDEVRALYKAVGLEAGG